MKAQIFLSCGQNPKYGEPEIVAEIKKQIEKELGFECYVAVSQQSLRGLRENIFNRLRETDYFLFIDFKRETLNKRIFESRVHRGSLFANQELAIASFLDLDSEVLLIQENGVETRGGMLGAIQGNIDEKVFCFSDRESLPAFVCEKIKERHWVNETRNRLNLSVFPRSDRRLFQPANGFFSRPFHIMVENMHHRKDARNVFAYLDEVVDVVSGRNISKEEKWETAEFKWAGTRLASVRIAPRPSYRMFDAAWIFEKNGEQTHAGFFNPTAPSPTDYFPHKILPGRYQLTFVVVCDNFEPIRKSFVLEFGQTLASAKFEIL